MRLIDAEELERLFNEQIEQGATDAFDAFDDALQDTATVDAVPVTRCEDCEYAERYERVDGTAGYYCGHPQNTFTYGEYWDRVFKPAKEADDYCNYGKRKDGGDG